MSYIPQSKAAIKFLCADLLFFLVMLQCLNDCFVGMFFACAEFFLVKLLTHMEDFSVTACGVSDNKTTGEDKIAFISKKMFIKTTRLYEKSYASSFGTTCTCISMACMLSFIMLTDNLLAF